LGRAWLPEFSRRFEDAVFVSSAAESSWLAEGGGQRLYRWPRPSRLARSGLAMFGDPGDTYYGDGGWPSGATLEATAQQDVPLPLPVHAVWTARSAQWSHRELLASFAGGENSPSRSRLFRIFGDAGASQTEVPGSVYLTRDNHWRRALHPRPDVAVHGRANRVPIQEASELMYRSKLCFVLDGDQPNTQRIVEAVAHGCIPLVVSSRWVPPFRRLVAWHKFAIFIREEEVDRLPALLEELSNQPQRLESMHGQLRSASHALIHGGSERWSYGFNAFLIAELNQRREEGIMRQNWRRTAAAAAPDQRRRSQLCGKQGQQHRCTTQRRFTWYRGSHNSSSPDFWQEWMLPAEDEGDHGQ